MTRDAIMLVGLIAGGITGYVAFGIILRLVPERWMPWATIAWVLILGACVVLSSRAM